MSGHGRWLPAALGQGLLTGLISTSLYTAALVTVFDEAFDWAKATVFFTAMAGSGVVSHRIASRRLQGTHRAHDGDVHLGEERASGS